MKQFLATFFVTILLSLNCIAYGQGEDLYELSSINFEGNDEFGDAELKEVIQSKETPFWLLKFLYSFTPVGSPPNYFDSTAITVDIVSLKSFYSVNGFFNADISYSYNLDRSSKTAELNYKISEGNSFTYGDVNVRGLEI